MLRLLLSNHFVKMNFLGQSTKRNLETYSILVFKIVLCSLDHLDLANLLTNRISNFKEVYKGSGFVIDCLISKFNPWGGFRLFS